MNRNHTCVWKDVPTMLRRLYKSGLVLAISCLLLSMAQSASAQCTSPSMVFKNPTLVSGTARQVGAVYRFYNVTTGVDATIEVMALVGGAALNDMDNTTQGYANAWQPYVTAGARGTSYLDWKITFKVAGTARDTVLKCLSITAVDVDGDGGSLKEFVQASTPGAYAINPASLLTITFDGINSKAVGSLLTVPNIDTLATLYMFQMNFSNISTISYRNGSISTKSSTDVRHTCIYFKPFSLLSIAVLPVKLLSLQAIETASGHQLQWSATDEKDLRYYVAEYSADGVVWEAGDTIAVTATTGISQYSWRHKPSVKGKWYYRLKQGEVQGGYTYSHIVSAGQSGPAITVNVASQLHGNTIPVTLSTPAPGSFQLAVYNLQGAMVQRLQYAAHAGINRLQLGMAGSQPAGTYVLAIRDQQGIIVHRTKLIR